MAGTMTVLNHVAAAYQSHPERIWACRSLRNNYQFLKPRSFSPSGVSAAVAPCSISHRRGSPGKNLCSGDLRSCHNLTRSRARRFVIFLCREHGDVLGESRTRRIIAPGAVRQQAVPNDKIAGVHRQGSQFQAGHVRYAGIAIRRLRLDPALKAPMKTGDDLQDLPRLLPAHPAKARTPCTRMGIGRCDVSMSQCTKPLEIPIGPRRRDSD